MHEHHQVGASARHLHLRERAVIEDGEHRVGQHLIVGLVFGDVVQFLFAELQVGDRSEERLHRLYGFLDVVVNEGGIEVAGKPAHVAVDAHHAAQEILHEAHLHLSIGEVERVARRIEVVALDGEVARLVKQGQGRGHAFGGYVELGRRHLQLRQVEKVGVETAHRLEKEGGCATAEPIVVELLRPEHVHQAEGVVDVGRLLPEMIAVIVEFQHVDHFPFGKTVFVGEQLYVHIEVGQQFLLCDAT